MIDPIQLAAVVIEDGERRLRRMPLAQDVQDKVTALWNQQFESLVAGAEKLEFDPAYTPEEGEVFTIEKFSAPGWLARRSEAVRRLQVLPHDEEALEGVRGIAGFTRLGTKELVLFQNFSRSHILKPGFSLFMDRESYRSIDTPGLSLGDKLAGVLYSTDEQLVFGSFRAMNVVVPLAEYYREANEQEIRQVLANPALAPENVEAVAVDATQWMQKRFALLADSDVLTKYKPKMIQTRGKQFSVKVRVKDGKIVFPADRQEAKRLLQFLNEEIFFGAITSTRFTTNSKRVDQ